MFFLLRFIIAWIIWFIFADKKRWRELFSISFFASAIGSSTDHLMHYFDLWRYESDFINKFIINAIDDWGIYVVVTYLFIQWLPKNRKLKNMLIYWFVWSTSAISIEFMHIKTNHMTYNNGWSLLHSYISDWILFFLFYKVYQLFKYESLSDEFP